MIKLSVYKMVLIAGLLFALGSCKKDSYEIPNPKKGLQNDLIKRSLGPNIVGGTIEFAYAMALLPEEGKIVSASVETSIAGAQGTYLENRSFYTNSSGVDVGVPIGDASVTTGQKTEVTFTKDTAAATLRFFYQVPEAARGKTVSFIFRAKASNGQTVEYKTEAYEVRKMDMLLDLVAKDGDKCYISLSDLKVYNAAEAAANPGKIDLVYLYRTVPNLTFAHALVAPSADPVYLPGIVLPAQVNNRTKIVKAWTVRDQQLARLQYGVYVDDIDLSSKDFTDAPDFAINAKAEGGVWVQTADKKYNAFVFVNSVNNTTKEMKISIKRLAL